MAAAPTKSYDHLLKVDYLRDLYPQLPHPLRPEQHAFQFLPFDALDGYDDAIAESDRVVTEDLELSDEDTARLDETIAYLCAHLKEQPQLSLTYFCADKHKTGGKLITLHDRLYQIDAANRVLVLKSAKQKIPFKLIRELRVVIKQKASRS